MVWFLSPLLFPQISSIAFMFGFLAPYWLFVIAAFLRESYRVDSYLKKHYSWEVKQRTAQLQTLWSSGSQVDLSFIFSFSPPGDEQWKALQSHYRKFFPFPFISFGAVPCMVILYGFLLHKIY